MSLLAKGVIFNEASNENDLEDELPGCYTALEERQRAGRSWFKYKKLKINEQASKAVNKC